MARKMRTRVKRFFRRYAEHLNGALERENDADLEAVVDAFAERFVEAGPEGVTGGKRGFKLRLTVPRGLEHYRALGATALRVERVEVTRLDKRHAMARVASDSRYRREDAVTRVRFTNIYFVQLQDGEPEIFAWITGDERKRLRKRGLAA